MAAINFKQIDEECKQNFVPKNSKELTNVEAWALKHWGDKIRSRKSQFFWSDGTYSWFTSEKQDEIYRVWIDKETGRLIFEGKSGAYYNVIL